MSATTTSQPVFDAHLHIIDPRFPLIANQGFTPNAFTVDDYLQQSQPLNIQGGAVVSGSFQGFDQSYLTHALEQLGDSFVGVTQLPIDVTDAAITELDRQGIKAVRFNLKRGGSAGRKDLLTLANRVYDIAGWHAELYIDSTELMELEAVIANLPAASIDHLGLSADSLPVLLRLAEQGVKIKACGFGRVDFDVATALQTIYQTNPSALMFGTDLPSTRAPRAFAPTDLTLVENCLGENSRQVLWDNAANFYRLKSF